MYTIGLDLGGTFIKGGLVDDGGKIVAKSKIPTRIQAGPEAVAADMAAQALALMQMPERRKRVRRETVDGNDARAAELNIALALARRAACGKEARLYLISGADHCGPEFWAQEAVNAAAGFMRECLEKPQEK